MHIHPRIYAFYLQQVSHLHSRRCKCQETDYSADRLLRCEVNFVNYAAMTVKKSNQNLFFVRSRRGQNVKIGLFIPKLKKRLGIMYGKMLNSVCTSKGMKR